MTLGEAVVSAWKQVLDERKTDVDLEGKTYAIARTRTRKLKTVRFSYKNYQLDGIEQNPETASRWVNGII